jgi:hypothetical protein
VEVMVQAGDLKPGAILQLWNSQQSYENVKNGLVGDGHSVIFMGYGTVYEAIPVTNFNIILYTDQSGAEKTLDRTFYPVVFGANLIDKP